jgi:hypothetical protein
MYLADFDELKPAMSRWDHRIRRKPRPPPAASDEAARERALMMLNEQTMYEYAEVWERARLVCTVRRGE